MNVLNLLILLLISLLGGCQWFKSPKIDVNTVPITKPKLQIVNPAPIKPQSVVWIVVTPENASTVFADLTKKKSDLALFSLTDDGYENLSLNIAKMRKYIIEQNEIIAAYRKYYEGK